MKKTLTITQLIKILEKKKKKFGDCQVWKFAEYPMPICDVFHSSECKSTDHVNITNTVYVSG